MVRRRDGELRTDGSSGSPVVDLGGQARAGAPSEKHRVRPERNQVRILSGACRGDGLVGSTGREVL